MLNMPVFSRSFDFVVLQQKIASFSKFVSMISMAMLDIPMMCFKVSCEVILTQEKIAFCILDFFNHNFFPIEFIFLSSASSSSSGAKINKGMYFKNNATYLFSHGCIKCMHHNCHRSSLGQKICILRKFILSVSLLYRHVTYSC